MANVRYFLNTLFLGVFICTLTYYKGLDWPRIEMYSPAPREETTPDSTSVGDTLEDDHDSADLESPVDSDDADSSQSNPSTNTLVPNISMDPMTYCSKLLEGDEETVAIAKSINRTQPVLEDTEFVHLTRDCHQFVDRMGYNTRTPSEEELSFPLAYTMLVHKEVTRVERLLRAIYRPHNSYCIHVDLNANRSFHEAMSAVTGCFDNVFIPSKLVDVVWGKYSLLAAEHVCIKELLARSDSWKYYLNLAAEEFPLKTNLELVRILTALNGSNVVQALQSHQLHYRWESQLPAPYNLSVIKGQWHVAVTRRFVRYLFTDPRARAFNWWVRHTLVPDETLVPTVNHNPALQAPGAYTGWPESNTNGYVYIGRHVVWQRKNRKPCLSRHFVRNVCIFGVESLKSLPDRKELFLNKFTSDFQPLALDCMEELLYNRSREDITGVNRLNLTFYSSLPQVKNHIP